MFVGVLCLFWSRPVVWQFYMKLIWGDEMQSGRESREKAEGISQNGAAGVAACPRGPEVSPGFWSEHHDDVWCCQFWPRLKCEQPILLALSCQFLTHSTDHYLLSAVFFFCFVCVSFTNSVAALHSSSRQAVPAWTGVKTINMVCFIVTDPLMGQDYLFPSRDTLQHVCLFLCIFYSQCWFLCLFKPSDMFHTVLSHLLEMTSFLNEAFAVKRSPNCSFMTVSHTVIPQFKCIFLLITVYKWSHIQKHCLPQSFMASLHYYRFWLFFLKALYWVTATDHLHELGVEEDSPLLGSNL